MSSLPATVIISRRVSRPEEADRPLLKSRSAGCRVATKLPHARGPAAIRLFAFGRTHHEHPGVASVLGQLLLCTRLRAVQAVTAPGCALQYVAFHDDSSYRDKHREHV